MPGARRGRPCTSSATSAGKALKTLSSVADKCTGNSQARAARRRTRSSAQTSGSHWRGQRPTSWVRNAFTACHAWCSRCRAAALVTPRAAIRPLTAKGWSGWRSFSPGAACATSPARTPTARAPRHPTCGRRGRLAACGWQSPVRAGPWPARYWSSGVQWLRASDAPSVQLGAGTRPGCRSPAGTGPHARGGVAWPRGSAGPAGWPQLQRVDTPCSSGPAGGSMPPMASTAPSTASCSKSCGKRSSYTRRSASRQRPLHRLDRRGQLGVGELIGVGVEVGVVVPPPDLFGVQADRSAACCWVAPRSSIRSTRRRVSSSPDRSAQRGGVGVGELRGWQPVGHPPVPGRLRADLLTAGGSCSRRWCCGPAPAGWWRAASADPGASRPGRQGNAGPGVPVCLS